MKAKPLDLPTVRRIQPLLASIAREIDEREHTVRALEERLEELTKQPLADAYEVRRLAAEAALNHRELRAARAELDALGCSVIGLEPITLRVPGPGGVGGSESVAPVRSVIGASRSRATR